MNEPRNKPIPSASDEPTSVKPVKFIQNQHTQTPTYHADGGWGVNNHHGLIRISFYTENPPIPTAIIQPVRSDGRPQGEAEMEGTTDSDHFVVQRDFQCNIVLPLSGAVQVHRMLGNFIQIVQQEMMDQLEETRSQIKQMPSE